MVGSDERQRVEAHPSFFCHGLPGWTEKTQLKREGRGDRRGENIGRSHQEAFMRQVNFFVTVFLRFFLRVLCALRVSIMEFRMHITFLKIIRTRMEDFLRPVV
jgi:hypothetical protein